jgi:hypothetical protein
MGGVRLWACSFDWGSFSNSRMIEYLVPAFYLSGVTIPYSRKL